MSGVKHSRLLQILLCDITEKKQKKQRLWMIKVLSPHIAVLGFLLMTTCRVYLRNSRSSQPLCRRPCSYLSSPSLCSHSPTEDSPTDRDELLLPHSACVVGKKHIISQKQRKIVQASLRFAVLFAFLRNETADAMVKSYRWLSEQ